VLDSTKKRLANINPIVAYHVGRLLYALELENIWVEVCQGLRSWNEQQALYEKGRAFIDGKWMVSSKSSIVTNCPPGHSWHNFGLAVDLCLDDSKHEGFQAIWDDKDIRWQKMVSKAKEMGFVCGVEFRSFPDKPHFQMTGRFPVSPDSEVRQLFKDGGVKAVWDESGLH
jgi:peptidoglycan L-alanyl-D-glutamate endopeptidase CwlK